MGETSGFFIHAAIAVDADEEAALGLVAAQIWNRREHQQIPRRQRRLRRWIEQTFRTLKSDGLKPEECQTQDPWRLLNLSALAL